MLSKALTFASRTPKWSALLEELGPAIVSDCQHILQRGEFQPVHGELGPCALLKGRSALQAVDVRFSGYGPPAIDLATAFRWMWEERLATAQKLWQTWLEGYREERKPSQLELESLPALGCLQQIYWLNVELTEALAEKASEDELAWYVEDHCRAIKVLMAKR